LTDLSLFREPQRARRDLDHLRALLPDKILDDLQRLLADSPDPDQVLNLFERLAAQLTGEVVALLETNRVLLHYLIAIFGHSYWLGEALLHNPDLISALSHDRHLDRPLEKEDYREGLARFLTRSEAIDISALLARFRKREYVRIVLRDALGLATLAETSGEISALSDAILEEALRHAEAEMHRRHGPPAAGARFSVISLGKLGGNELNYSSDVDLFYLYSGNSSDPAALREYFVHQAQLLTDILCRTTREGPVFRIDLRLRPQGREGEPAIALRHAIDYYTRLAHDWELQALIKARCSAGDPEPVRQFMRAVQSRIYTDKLNFAAIETALLARERIGARRRRELSRLRPEALDIKLDPGGIRDIEFLVQCLQRVYGGEEKWLRSGGTLFSLQKLHDKGHISGHDFHELTLAYTFLRKLEHRLQLQRGQQTHKLPADSRQLQMLRRQMPTADLERKGETGQELVDEVQSRMTAVNEIYQRVIHRHRGREKTRPEALPAPPRAASAREMSFAQLLERLALDYASPGLHAIASRADLSLHTRRNLHRFLSSAMTSPPRFAPLMENPQRLESALALLETSEYLTDILVRHPDVITLLHQRELAPAGDQPGFEANASDDSLAHLRRGFRKYSFALGARDVLSPRPALQSLRENTRIADVAIRLALKVAGGDRSLAVFALGRLGTEEFDIASDADLLFVRPPDADEEEARVCAEGLVHELAAYTREGSVFAVDARLRPHGGEGELLVTPQQLERYLAEEAQPWEALTYTKLRFVAGRDDLKPQVLSSVWHRIIELAAQPGFTQAVREMRTRLENSNRYPHSFKLARGGFYDIDFIASYLMLRHASLAGNTLDRLRHLQRAGALDATTAHQLNQAAVLYRTADHVIRLVTGRARPELPEAEHARAAVEALLAAMLGGPRHGRLQDELQETAEGVRKIFDRIVTE
jgi:[glutamine synthetase] adenylyltransferase / [glutamine synthetase]-adenylyl-L-tyrosine phosphorylase